jgi:HK97 family phage portal protein
VGFIKRALGLEARASLENPKIPISSENVLQYFGLTGSASGVTVGLENALGIPAYWCGVNFISKTMASLPMQAFEKTDAGRVEIKGGISDIVHSAVNEGMSSFEWRKYSYDQVFTGGRSFTWVERSAANKVINLWPLDPQKTTVRRMDGKKFYQYRQNGKTITYDASEVIDIPYMLKSDMLQHRGPISQCRDVLGLAIAANEYGSRFFQNGGVPPFAMTGPLSSPGALQRASQDLDLAVKQAAKDNRLALVMPSGHEIKPIGVDPEKTQLEQLQRFLIEQIARILGLPPVFLQDLTHGTFTNTEQQDLFLVKHCISSLCRQFEDEINLKVFGRGSKKYIEFNLDGLLRGDFKTRMDGYAQGIQHGIYMPNEARRFENLPDVTGGDKPYMQGAMMPIEKLGMGQVPPPVVPPKAN